VALRADGRYLAVAADGSASLAAGAPGVAHSFQWIETPTGELVLMALSTNRFLRIDPATGAIAADSAGPRADAGDGVRFVWRVDK
jgi:xylan 1,4-beta-xylosidase